MKRFYVILLILLVLLTACQSTSTTNDPEQVTNQTTSEEASSQETLLELTLEELKAYNGQDGMPSYVAHNGTVYDVSAVPQWNGGKHNGQVAGTDITGKIEKAPHGVKNLELAKKVGIIID